MKDIAALFGRHDLATWFLANSRPLPGLAGLQTTIYQTGAPQAPARTKKRNDN